jgi:hypothetical protein
MSHWAYHTHNTHQTRGRKVHQIVLAIVFKVKFKIFVSIFVPVTFPGVAMCLAFAIAVLRASDDGARAAKHPMRAPQVRSI